MFENNYNKFILYSIIICIFYLILYKNKKINIKYKILLLIITIYIILSINKTSINENFDSPVNYRGPGDYSSIMFKNKKNKNKLIKSDRLYTPQGTPFPMKVSVSGLGSKNGTHVDGLKSSPQDMFMFAYNECKPECCNTPGGSNFSCDKGCVCITKPQQNFLTHRGNNNII